MTFCQLCGSFLSLVNFPTFECDKALDKINGNYYHYFIFIINCYYYFIFIIVFVAIINSKIGGESWPEDTYEYTTDGITVTATCVCELHPKEAINDYSFPLVETCPYPLVLDVDAVGNGDSLSPLYSSFLYLLSSPSLFSPSLSFSILP